MPNGNKNNGNDDIELLPLELRRPEEKKKKEERPEVKLFVPETEEKPQKSTFMGKFFSSKQTQQPISPPPKPTVQAEELDLSIFKMQKDAPKAAPVSPPPPTRFPPPLPSKPVSPPPRPIIEQRPPQKFESKRPQPNVPKKNLPKPSGEKNPPDITLIPAEEVAVKEKRGKSRQIILLVAVAVTLALIGVGVYLALKWYENKTELALQKVEADLEVIDKKNRELASEKDQAQFFQKKLKTADKLLGSHIYWTNFFSFLEKNTVADVYFVNLIGGNDGQVVLSGVAKSYKAMARQIVSFRADDRVSKVSIMSASASVDTEGNVVEVNFDAKLQLSSEIFLK